MGLSINNSVRLSNYKKQENNMNGNPNFKGLGIGGIQILRFLDNSPALGAVAVDLGSMVIPRTAVDAKNRGADAGLETGVREASSSVNHAIVGLVGAGAATALSGVFNKNYGVQANKMFVNADAIDIFGEIWKNSATKTKKEFYTKAFEMSEGLNGSTWQKLALQGEETVADYGLTKGRTLPEALSELLSQITDKSTKKEIKAIKKQVIDVMTSNTGAGKKFKIEIAGNKKLMDSAGVFVDDMLSLAKGFEKQTGNLPEFIENLKHLKGRTAILGLGISALIGMSVQPINKLLTKKRTGQDGFVGVKGQKADKSFKFKFAKTLAGLSAGTAAVLSIGNLKETAGKLQYSSVVPNLNQFKLLYGMTIMSRLLSARGGDELREGLIKDTLGFTNWLIFGGMVTKLAARAIGGKGLINYIPKDASEKGFKHGLKWLVGAAAKSYDEVLLSDTNVKNLLKAGEKLDFSKMFKTASKAGKKNVAILAAAQLIGYLYSGLVLGIGIAKFNIFVTKKVNKAREAKGSNVAFSGTDKTNSLYFAAHNQPHKKVFEDIFKAPKKA